MRIITKAVLAVSMAVMCAGTAHAQEKGTDQKPYRYEGSVNISFSHMINPVNWTTDAVPAALNDSVTVTVDTLSHLLIVDGLDPEAYFLSSLAPMFPLGNYHLQELTLYQQHLRRNTALRLYHFEK